jgi:hypothetical protein
LDPFLGGRSVMDRVLKDNKSIQFNLRFRPGEFSKLKQTVNKLDYISMAQFVREAIKEKINTELKGKDDAR